MIRQGLRQAVQRAAVVQEQRHLHRHSLREVAHRRRKDRLARQARMDHDFGNVLVTLVQAIDEMGGGRAILVFSDQRLAAAGIAADGIDRQRLVRRDQASRDQGGKNGDGTGRIAARVADQPRARDPVARGCVQFGKPESPAFVHPVRGGCVDDPRVQILCQFDRLPRSIIRQAQDRHVGLFKGLAPGARILAAVGVDGDQADVVARFQPLADLQPRGACLAVDENAVCHEMTPDDVGAL